MLTEEIGRPNGINNLEQLRHETSACAVCFRKSAAVHVNCFSRIYQLILRRYCVSSAYFTNFGVLRCVAKQCNAQRRFALFSCNVLISEEYDITKHKVCIIIKSPLASLLFQSSDHYARNCKMAY